MPLAMSATCSGDEAPVRIAAHGPKRKASAITRDAAETPARLATSSRRLILRAWAFIGGERVLYQEGALDGMLPVKVLIDGCFGGKGLPDGCAMFGGTFAAKGGIRPASRFEFELEDPVLKRNISHGYDVITMPVLG